MAIPIRTRLVEGGVWSCYADTRGLGTIVVSQANSEFKAQNRAAKFMDANFLEEEVTWEGGYHGGDTSSATGDLLGHYGEKR